MAASMTDRPSSDTPLPSLDEVARVVAVLERLAGDPDALAAVPEALRLPLRVAAGRIARPDGDSKRALRKALRRKVRAEAREHDLAILAARATRSAERNPVVAAGVAPPSLPYPAPYPAPHPVPAAAEPPPDADLREPRDCYVCKAPFVRVHPHYHALCPPCAELNWQKREQSCPLDGRVAVVTGGRVKIGYHIVLKLLRAGARVVATTRFAHDAALRFMAEPDHDIWEDRLELHGLDLRHLPSVERFAAHLVATLPRLDFLINNAAQTVRRPPAFYAHLLEAEGRPVDALPAPARRLLAARDALVAELDPGSPEALARAALTPLEGLVAPARLSQLALAPEDHAAPEAFPLGRLDGDLQQIDLREVNSWRLTAAEVSTPELIEVHLVNALSPFLLCARLKELFLRTRTGDQHIVNVSAMEASFSRRKKTDKHPHTNMAKAALNMLTRTSAADYVKDGIHLNSVDTGWVTDEDPLQHVSRKQAVHDFHPPLDAIDGAARVLDPIFTGFATGVHPFGLFFKDYRAVDW
jgi:NAD(P)-dependent dehydrogenase (short-subunit alcohol dehydrogenase family)